MHMITKVFCICSLDEGTTAPVGQDLLIIEASRSHSDTPHSVRLLWTRDQPVAETTHNTQKRQISMPSAGF